MKIGFLQLRPKFGNVKHNVRAAKSLLKNISDATIVLPELFNTGYLFRSKEELLKLSEPLTGFTVSEMKALAKQKNLNLIFGMAQKKARKAYNAAILVTAKGKVYDYQKIHLFDREKLFFAPGEKAPAVYKLDEARIGVMVCFDWIFPEVARVLALKGAQVIFHPANLVLPHGQDAMRIRSIENRVFTVTANRIGSEKGGNFALTFTGKSQIVAPDGEILSNAGERSESLKIVEIDPAQADDKGVTPNNNIFEDRRVALYKTIVSKRTG